MSAGNAERIQPRPLSNRGYTITERIGEGSFGTVVAARSARHHCQMAIKIIRKPPGENDGDRAAFRWSINNEKRFAHKFDHPYINAYHEIIETTKRLYFVMDYYKNGTLLDYYNEVDYTPEPVAYAWFAQLSAALEYVHGHCFAHRDVKLDNVLLDHRRRVRLADFGMCVAVARPRRSRPDGCGGGGGDKDDDDGSTSPRPSVNSSVCGSPQYMSPELLACGPYHGQLADVWAAGVLLYCLVTGRFPYPGNDKKKIIERQKSGYSFKRKETQRLSAACQQFFKNIFTSEKNRKEITELKKDDWMVEMSRAIQIPFFE